MVELRDGEAGRYHGKGVQKAVKNVNRIIAPRLKGMAPEKQEAIDRFMIDLDGTENKAKLGANAILGVSIAVAKAAALNKRKPIYKYIYNLFLIRFDIMTQLRNMTFDFNILDIEIMQVLLIYSALFIAVIMLYFASRHTNDKVRRYGSIYIIPYFFLYYVILSVLVIKSLLEIIIRKKQKW